MKLLKFPFVTDGKPELGIAFVRRENGPLIAAVAIDGEKLTPIRVWTLPYGVSDGIIDKMTGEVTEFLLRILADEVDWVTEAAYLNRTSGLQL